MPYLRSDVPPVCGYVACYALRSASGLVSHPAGGHCVRLLEAVGVNAFRGGFDIGSWRWKGRKILLMCGRRGMVWWGVKERWLRRRRRSHGFKIVDGCTHDTLRFCNIRHTLHYTSLAVEPFSDLDWQIFEKNTLFTEELKRLSTLEMN